MSRRARNRPDKRAPLPVPEWFFTWEPLPANEETPDPEGDAYWLDALADANSGSEELNRRTQ
jgi:hypothetical protein